MGLYNFKPQFRAKIQKGLKNHTIRGWRKHIDKPGDVLHLYTGLRTKSAKLIKRVICTRVEPLQIAKIGHDVMVIVDGYVLDPYERRALAVADGFDSWPEMLEFWNGRLPFSGCIIHWRDMTPAERSQLRRKNPKKRNAPHEARRCDLPKSKS